MRFGEERILLANVAHWCQMRKDDKVLCQMCLVSRESARQSWASASKASSLRPVTLWLDDGVLVFVGQNDIAMAVIFSCFVCARCTHVCAELTGWFARGHTNARTHRVFDYLIYTVRCRSPEHHNYQQRGPRTSSANNARYLMPVCSSDIVCHFRGWYTVNILTVLLVKMYCFLKVVNFFNAQGEKLRLGFVKRNLPRGKKKLAQLGTTLIHYVPCHTDFMNFNNFGSVLRASSAYRTVLKAAHIDLSWNPVINFCQDI